MHNVRQYEPISIMNCPRVNSPGILIHLYSFYFFRIWRAQRERTLHQHKGINQIWLHYMNIFGFFWYSIDIFKGETIICLTQRTEQILLFPLHIQVGGSFGILGLGLVCTVELLISYRILSQAPLLCVK